MIAILVLLAAGLFLSAFFSGSETGFYRVSRVRLMLDALGGDRIARGLLWLTNNPALFVATTLVGNNLANYITSLAIVLAAARLFGGDAYLAEFVAPVALAPLVFVYGELLPKNLFFHAPNQLLRRGGPLFLAFAVLFAPISGLLWILGRLLQELVGEAPLRVQLTLARKELQQVLQEGQEAGILQPAQRMLAQSLFAIATQPVLNFCTPPARVASVRLGAKKSEVLRLARRHGASVVPVAEARGRKLAGYVRIIDLYLDNAETIESARPLLKISQNQSHIAALIRMQSKKEELACVVDDQGVTVGLLYASELTDPLFRGQ